MILDPRLPERISLLLIPEPNSGCWLCCGTRWSRNGYGRVWHEGREQQLHRVVWQLLVGPVCPVVQLDHKCRVRACSNPAHLDPVWPAVNTHRGRAVLFKRAEAYL